MSGDIEEIAISVLAHTGYDTSGTDNLPFSQQAPIDDGPAMPSHVYHPFGFKGRPRGRSADSNGRTIDGARVLYLVDKNDETHCINLDDPRRTPKLPQCDEGGSQWYADVDDAVSSYDGQGNLTLKVPAGKTLTIDVGGGITIVASSSGVKIKGITPTAPMLVGDAATATPTNAVLCGSPANVNQVPSTVLFAATT